MAGNEDQAAEQAAGTLLITATFDATGIFISLKTDGMFSDETISRRFYSIPESPPPGLPSDQFWGAILASVSYFLTGPEAKNGANDGPQDYPEPRLCTTAEPRTGARCTCEYPCDNYAIRATRGS